MTDTREMQAEAASDPFRGFQTLMPYRVRDILMVSSLYDSYTLQEEGRLHELIISEFLELNLHSTPGLSHVSSGTEALAMAKESNRFELIITTLNLADMTPAQLAQGVKDAGLDATVVVLAYDQRRLKDFISRNDTSAIDRFFLWQGDSKILLAIVKYVEDRLNVYHDTRAAGVRVILVVEDSIRYYSAFLPVMYTEVISQSRHLISEGVNLLHKLARMRARPKILLCTNFEEASEAFHEHRDYILGVISDIQFPRGGRLDHDAGFALAEMVKTASPDTPILLQSSRPALRPRALEVGGSFLLKGSPTLLYDLRRFMIDKFAFGDFVFRLNDRSEVDRASDLKTLEDKLETVPAECIGYHGERNDFSTWLLARTEFALAYKLRPRKVSDFHTLDDLRRDLIASIGEYRSEQSEGVVSDFDRHSFDNETNYFARIGEGSLGGKARGLAFLRHLLSLHRMSWRTPGVHMAVPPAVVLATDVFDRFLESNDILDFALRTNDDAAITRRFLSADLPKDVVRDLETYLRIVRCPLAVRSSSLLEDSQYHPFTGVYETFMLPNNQATLNERLEHLVAAVKRVYASTFSEHAKNYFRATPYRLEEERMGVIIQEIVGKTHGSRFYPDFAGVARSHNFYPVPPATPDDGTAAVALGLGREVVEGGKCLTFCPRYPQNILQFSSVEDILNNSQRDFWALDLHPPETYPVSERGYRETLFGLEAAEADGTLSAVGSTYSNENRAIYDGLSRQGVRLVSFAPILKHGLFPLPELLNQLLSVVQSGLNRPVEIEFAVALPSEHMRAAEFGVLQMRPLVVSREAAELNIEETDPSRLICSSKMVLGNGRIEDLRDIVVVDFHRFDRGRSQDAAHEVARFNAVLTEAGVSYLLIGVGRWGSNDPWLGIPVTWDEISGARAIVETGFRDMRVTPSQGSHFFQNLVAFQVGYFTVNPEAGEGFVDWDWLGAHPATAEGDFVRHLHFDEPLTVTMNGRTNEGIIHKPGLRSQ
jgi:CheY-like chemotaxis protein